MSAVSQVAVDLSVLGSKSTPRRSSFSGSAVRRASTVGGFGFERRKSDAEWIFGSTDEEQPKEDWEFQDHVWQSRVSKDDAMAAAPLLEASAEELAEFALMAQAEARIAEARGELFASEALQWSMALEALQRSCWTLRKAFKGPGKAFEYLASHVPSATAELGEAELREALSAALQETPSLTIPLWQAW